MEIMKVPSTKNQISNKFLMTKIQNSKQLIRKHLWQMA